MMSNLAATGNPLSMFKCNVSGCRRTFNSQQDLDSHITKHKSGYFKCACTYCGKPFAHDRARIGHENVHHLKVKNFKCECCGKAYSYESSLRNHLKVSKDCLDKLSALAAAKGHGGGPNATLGYTADSMDKCYE